MSDDEREAEIILSGDQVMQNMAEWNKSGCFAARGAAERALVQMTELIRGRSSESVKRMEIDRGLA